MRVGAIGDQHIRIVCHPLRHIGVQVEGDDDRRLRAEVPAQARQKLALGVLMVVADHGAVKMQQHAVDRPLHLDGIEDHRGNPLERLVGHDARWVGVGGDRVNEAPAELVRCFEGRAKG